MASNFDRYCKKCSSYHCPCFERCVDHHDWQIWMGFGKASGNEIFQRCQNCGKQEQISVNPEAALRIEFNE